MNLPDPCLLGIVLTISTHSGPQVVYHYPPVDALSSRKKKKKQELEQEIAVQSSNESGPGRWESAMQRKKSLKSHHEIESEADFSVHSLKTEDLDNPETSDSSDSDTSTGLSDSDISTDYADLSSGSNSSGSDDEFPINSDETGALRLSSDNNASLQSLGNSLKSNTRDLHTSASRVFQYLSPQDSKRNSIVSKHTLNRDQDVSSPIMDQESDGEAPNMYELDEQHFGTEFQAINKVLRFDADFFAEVSSPPKEMCNTRFELSIDELVLVGLPIHRDPEGQWRKSKKKRYGNRSRHSNSSSRARHTSHSLSGTTDANGNSNIPLNDGPFSPIFQVDANGDDYRDLAESVNMFHLCFLLNPQLVEYNERVDDMYHYVISRLSLILRYAQAKTAFVTNECLEILKTRDHVLKNSQRYQSIKGQGNKGKYLYQKILNKSALARIITKCFDAISKNEVANLEIDEDKMVSLQIPLKDEFSVLPDVKVDPVLKGSFLTSILNHKFLEKGSKAESIEQISNLEQDDDLLNYALLLLNEPAAIIQELQYSSFQNDVASVILTSLVKNLKPTVPLRSYQYIVDEVMGESNSIDGDQRNSIQSGMLRSLALHLMYWRHARIILPISSKSTYIVSPLAPVSGSEKDHSKEKEEHLVENKPLIFQNQDVFAKRFPSLPPLASFLSLISSSKPRPFGAFIPSKDHKSVYLNALSWLIRHGYLTQLLTFVWVRVDSRIKIAVDEDLERDGVKRSKTSRQLNTGTNDNTAAPDLQDDLPDELDLYYYGGDEDVFNRADYTIILNPERATAVEKRWLYKCVEDQPSEVQALFHKLVKYFNGSTPLELTLIREGISRHEIRKLMQALGKYLVEINHW
ncbi:LAME_0H16512g1_1 [Lachancea meyersii CBS 8951]|uniref:Nitrogen permease regulator 3 n=1 Tax=Lachancea meyersii CBS 8951 TaxID=1266667 RepID=A0A1G4KI81_9SACH|nr:LAME_0H16512g1_1 [Lachancea meyersii CBS 8951]